MSQQWSKVSEWAPAKRQAQQLKKLRYLVKYILPYHPYYRELFKRQNLTASDFRTIDDIQKIPFTSKQELVPTETSPAQPRQFIVQPDEHLIKKYAPKKELLKLLTGKVLRQDVKLKLEKEFKPIHVHFTTGRSSAQIPFTYTLRDLHMLAETGSRLFNVLGATRDDIVVNAFPFAPHLAFWLAKEATRTSGLMALHTGGGKIMGTKKIIGAVQRMKATLLISMPGYGYHIIREAVNNGVDLSTLKFIVFGGERVSLGMRKKLHTLFDDVYKTNPKMLATYAATEFKTAWMQCHEDSGYHTYPDIEHVEIVDEEGSPVPAGQKGEVVYSSLDWRGTIVLRYRTGDIATKGMEPDVPCRYCGRTVPRISMDIQRRSDRKDFVTKVKGELVDLNEFPRIMHDFAEVEEWQVVLRKKNNDPFEVDELVLRVATKNDKPLDPIFEKLDLRVREGVNVNPEIEHVPLQQLLTDLGMETEVKEKRIVDRRV